MFIYGLFDPRNDELRYIGKTNNVKNRHKKHLSDKELNYRTSWIKSLKILNILPSVDVLDEVPDSEWQFWEQWYIAYFRGIGCRLTNMTVGGDNGREGMKVSEETKQKISQKLKVKEDMININSYHLDV